MSPAATSRGTPPRSTPPRQKTRALRRPPAFNELFQTREGFYTYARTLSKTGNLEPTPRGSGASQVSDVPRQQRYSPSPSVTTQSFNRHTKRTKARLLLPVAPSSDRRDRSVLTQLGSGHVTGLLPSFHMSSLNEQMFFSFMSIFPRWYIMYRGVWAHYKYVIPVIFPI